jgi:hypothetical protein
MDPARSWRRSARRARLALLSAWRSAEQVNRESTAVHGRLSCLWRALSTRAG